MWSFDRIGLTILAFLFVLAVSAKGVIAQSFTSLTDHTPVRPSPDQDGLLPPRHNPASVPPADKPDTIQASACFSRRGEPTPTRASRRQQESLSVVTQYDAFTCDGLDFEFAFDDIALHVAAVLDVDQSFHWVRGVGH